MADIVSLRPAKPARKKSKGKAVIVWFKMPVAVYYGNTQCGVVFAKPLFETRDKA